MNRGFINKLWALIQYSWAEGRAPILTRFHGIVFSLVSLLLPIVLRPLQVFFYNLIDYRTIEPATSVVSSFALHLFYFAAWFYSVWAVNISVNTVRVALPFYPQEEDNLGSYSARFQFWRNTGAVR